MVVFPLFPRDGRTAQARYYPDHQGKHIATGGGGGMRMGKGLVLHQADGRPTAEAEAVLRHGAELALA